MLAYLESEEKKDIEIATLEDHVVIVGYDKIAKSVCKKLVEEYRVLVIDKNSQNTSELAASDYKYIYGDFKHGEIRKGANLEKAEFLISFSDEKEVNEKILEERKSETVTIVKSDSFSQAAELYDLGADYVIIENVLAGNRLSDYIELYLEDREVFLDEVKAETDRIRGDEGSQS